MPLPRRDPASAAAQRTIREAFEDLKKTVSATDLRHFENTTLKYVEKAALEIENQLAARQSLRNMRRLNPLFSGLGYYAKTIEVLCNGTPFLSWVWAPIKLILKISSDYVEAFEQIIKAYSRIAESLTRFKILSETFSKKVEFQQTFAVFYVDILRFHKEAYKFVRRSAWRVLFETSWGRFERRFNNILEDLKRHEQQIDKEANAYDIAEAKKSRDALKEWRQESLLRVEKDEQEKASHQFEAICSWLKKNETDQQLIFDKNFTDGSKYSGTCSWMFENPTITKWLRAGQTDITWVWLRGNPGTGKSIITSQLVNFLNASNYPVVISHFCMYSYASSTQYDEIVKSLLLQLVHTNRDVAAHIYEHYLMEKKATSERILETLLELVIKALVEDLGQKQSVYIIIDGLDEVEEGKQKRLIVLLTKILRSQPSNGAIIKILISSRPSHILEKELRKRPTVCLRQEKERVGNAIQNYAKQRLIDLSHRFSAFGLEQEDFVKVGRCVAEKADGMFLWARLVLDYLACNVFFKPEEIWDAVHMLPRKLTKFYERVLLQIVARFDQRSIDRMRVIFGWIAFSVRPLRKFELRSALSFTDGDTTTNVPVPVYILDLAMPLIYELPDSTLTFIHVSVKDYLQMPESKLPVVRETEIVNHALVSTTCLLSGIEVFDLKYSDKDRTMRVLKGLHGFHVYANEFWVDYVLEALSFNTNQGKLHDLHIALGKLSQALEKLADLRPALDDNVDSAVSDNRVNNIQQYPALHTNVKSILKARSERKPITMSSKEGSSSCDMIRPRKLQAILGNYQNTVRSLIDLTNYQGIPQEDLAQFKRDYSATVFTCRVPSCPRATIGFETHDLRMKHEATHSPNLKCPFPDCQYPPFQSPQTLRNHKARCHPESKNRSRILSHHSRTESEISTCSTDLSPAFLEWASERFHKGPSVIDRASPHPESENRSLLRSDHPRSESEIANYPTNLRPDTPIDNNLSPTNPWLELASWGASSSSPVPSLLTLRRRGVLAIEEIAPRLY